MKNVNTGILPDYLYTNKGAGAYCMSNSYFNNLIDGISGNSWKDLSGFVLSVVAYPFDLDNIVGELRYIRLLSLGGELWNDNNYPVHFKNFYQSYKASFLIAEYTFNNYANGSYKTFLDSDNYTKISVFLPYIGFKSVRASEVMGNSLKIYYSFDLMKGTVKAIFEVTTAQNVSYVIDSVSSVIGISFEITADNNARVKTKQALDSLKGLADLTTSVSMPFKQGFKSVTSRVGAIDNFSSLADSMAQVATFKQISTSGNDVTIAGQPNTPYMIIERPKVLNNSYIGLLGKPSGKNLALSQLTGFTQIQSIHLENIPATYSELNEIEKNNKKWSNFIKYIDNILKVLYNILNSNIIAFWLFSLLYLPFCLIPSADGIFILQKFLKSWQNLLTMRDSMI